MAVKDGARAEEHGSSHTKQSVKANQHLRRARLDIEQAIERYRDLYDFAPVGYLTLDQTGLILEANLMACTLFGVLRAQLGRRSMASFVSPDHRAALRQHLHDTFASSVRWRCELHVPRKGSDGIWILLESLRDERAAGNWRCHTAITEITDRKKAEIALVEAHSELERRVQDRTLELESANVALEAELLARKRAEQAQRASEAAIRALASEAELVEHRERKRLASDLHDGLSQLLALARIKLESIDRSSATAVEQCVRDVRSLLTQAQERAESLTFELNPPLLHDVGLVAATERLCEEITRDYGLEVRVAASAEQRPADEALRVTVFRALRELVVNAVRHARARHVVVRFDAQPSAIVIEVQDDGIGYEPGATAGFGLSNVRERITYLGGFLRFERRDKGGTRATLSVPLSSRRCEQGAGT